MIKKILSSELGKGALVLFILFNTYNVLNFIFHFVMGRMLGPADYGTLAVLMSLAYIYSFPSHAIQNLLSKYTSKPQIQKSFAKIKYLIVKGMEKSIKVGLIVFVLLCLISIFLSDFLRINFWLIFISNLLIFSSLNVPVVRGVLQGRKKFKELGWTRVLESLTKIFFAVSLVFLGMRVFGAIIGVLIGTTSGLIFSLYFNKDVLKKEKKKVSTKGIYFESFNYLIATGVIMLVFSLDIILAKRFFDPSLAGKYAVLSMIGKMIFFGTIAISKVMFPLTSEKHEGGGDAFGVFKKSLIIVAIICAISSLACFVIPKLLIGIFYGSQYIDVAQYLVYAAIALSFLSLTNITIYYGLSINRFRKSYLLFLFVVLEIILLTVFNNNLGEYLIAFMVSNIILFVGSLGMLKLK